MPTIESVSDGDIQRIPAHVRALQRAKAGPDVADLEKVGPRTVAQNPVASTRWRNYFVIMRKIADRFAAKRLTALIMCFALMIAGISAAVAMEHPGHDSSGSVVWTSSGSGSMDHSSHHMTSGKSDAECCEPDTTAASSCHISACCLSELQYSNVTPSTEHSRSACAQSMANLVGPSINTPLPERPPQLS